MDTVTKSARSRMMAAIRSKGNKSTEKIMRAHLVRSGFVGWRMHASDVLGKPDFVFNDERIAIFVDGCYWHGCPKCGRPARSNLEYWIPKIELNKTRDLRVTAALRRRGWRVLRIWEHDLQNSSEKAIQKLTTILAKQIQRLR